MSERETYPAGVPCWIESLQPDPQAAMEFYGALFGWEFSEPGPMPAGLSGQYFIARVGGRDVAGVGFLPAGGPAIPAWATYIRVESVDATAERVAAAGGAVLLGPVDAPPAGRLVVFSDPAGAAVCAWEKGEREGAQVVNEPGTWTMSALHVHDPASAIAFYGAVFGWQAEAFGPMTLLRLPGYVGGEEGSPVPRDVVAVAAPPDAAVPPHWNVNFRVADADAIAERAAGLGGSLIAPPFDTPGFRNAVIADPQGATFSISQLSS